MTRRGARLLNSVTDATPGAVPAVIGAVLFAIYCCVPETSRLPWVALVVASAAGVELGERATRRWLQVAVGVLVLWAGLDGGRYRASAVVGAVFAWWPVLMVAARRLVGGSADRFADAVVAGVGVVAAVAVARTGALSSDVGDAWWSVAVAAPLSALVSAAAVRTFRRR